MNRAVVFEKEYLRNSDLLEAFARSLPHFISDNPPEVRRKFMEEVIRHDDLWTNLELNIWNAQRSDSPTPDSLRVFESCCTVIDLAFSVLEGSQDVDWRSPKFGSLAQRFELFITHYFQGAFMGRATSFRIGVIRARYCNAILAQFSKDLAHDSTLSFRSQWDVASLARLIFALGLRGEDEDDLKFWNSHISGGYVGADFTGKAEKMIKLAERDGPLLIICHLGHLVLDALPRDQSGLNLEDMKNVLKLQERVIENRRLPLNRASDTVWEGLGRLREQVEQLCRNSSDEDREILRHLLWIIGDAFNCRGEGPSLRELAEEHGQNIPAAVDPTSSGRSSGVSNLARSAPGPTAATSVEPSTGTETGEGGSYFIRATSFYFLELSLTFGQSVQVLQTEFQKGSQTLLKASIWAVFHRFTPLPKRPLVAGPWVNQSVLPHCSFRP